MPPPLTLGKSLFYFCVCEFDLRLFNLTLINGPLTETQTFSRQPPPSSPLPVPRHNTLPSHPVVLWKGGICKTNCKGQRSHEIEEKGKQVQLEKWFIMNNYHMNRSLSWAATRSPQHHLQLDLLLWRWSLGSTYWGLPGGVIAWADQGSFAWRVYLRVC